MRLTGVHAGVLRAVDLDIPVGACVGLVGVNGAGKSTLLAVAAGVEGVTAGHVERTPGQVYLPEGFPVEPGIRVSRWLDLGRMLPGWEPGVAEAMLRELGLPREGRNLSQGERVRLGLILTLARRAPLYILDDPFLGLDPVARRAAERWIAHRSAEASVLVAAQDLAALERLCTSLVLLDRGRVLVDAPLEKWRARFRAVRVVGEVDVPRVLEDRLLQARGGVHLLDDPDEGAELALSAAGARVDPVALPLEEVMQALIAAPGVREGVRDGSRGRAPRRREVTIRGLAQVWANVSGLPVSGAPGLTSIQALRAAAWRELRGRPGLLLAAVLVPWGAGTLWDPILDPLATTLLAALLATRGPPGADPFWRGLGGPGWARVVGAALVHLPVFGVLEFLQVRPGLAWFVYVSVAAARSVRGGLAVFLAPLLGLLWGGVALAVLGVAFRQPPEGAGWAWMLAAAVGALVWEDRRGGVRSWRRAFGALAGMSVLLFFAALAASALPLGRYPVAGESTTEDGTFLLLPNGRLDGWSRPVLSGDHPPIDIPEVTEAWLGPRGSALLHHAGPEGSRELTLVSASGERRTCPYPRPVQDWSWRGDGRAVFVTTERSWSPMEGLVRGETEPREWTALLVAFDTDCTSLPDRPVAWLGNELAWGEGASVRTATRTVPVSGEVSELATGGGLTLVRVGEEISVVEPGGVRSIGSGDGLFAVPDGVCVGVVGNHGWECWNAAMEHHRLGSHEHPLAYDVVFDHADDEIRTGSGRVLANVGDAHANPPAWRLPSGDLCVEVARRLTRIESGRLAGPCGP